MSNQVLIQIVITLCAFIAILAFLAVPIMRQVELRRLNSNRYDKLNDFIKEKFINDEMNEALKESTFPINYVQYQIIRYSLLVLLIVLIVSNLFFKGGGFNLFQFAVPFILFVAFSPKQTIYKFKSPFQRMVDYFEEKDRSKKNLDVYRAISQLKNLSIAHKENPTSSDFILEQIAKFTKRTKPVFMRMISLWSLNKKEEACTYFVNQLGTKEAKNLADLFMTLDDLNPHELHEQLTMYQQFVREERLTAAIQRSESRSFALYFVVIVTAFVIMINFITVAFVVEFMEQLKFIY